MGWNDRLPDCDKLFESEAERQAYFDWQEYQDFLMRLEAELDAQVGPAVPGSLTSQTLDPAAIDIFGGSDVNISPKELARGQNDQKQKEDSQEDARDEKSKTAGQDLQQS